MSKDKILGVAAWLSTLAFAVPAMAQDSFGLSSDPGSSFDRAFVPEVRAGFHLTVPLGHIRKNTAKDQARVGFKVGFAKSYEPKYSSGYNAGGQSIRVYQQSELLDLGFRLDGKPNMLLNGQDIYTPLFDPKFAGERTDIKGSTAVKVGLVVVAVGAVGTVLVAKSFSDAVTDAIACSIGIDVPDCVRS